MTAGSKSDAWELEVRAFVLKKAAEERARKNEPRECRIPQETPLQILARIDDDPRFSHYSPCELSGLLARMWIMTFRLNHGEIVIEITDEGYRALQGASK